MPIEKYAQNKKQLKFGFLIHMTTVLPLLAFWEATVGFFGVKGRISPQLSKP